MRRIILFFGAYLLSTHMVIAQDTIRETKNICQLNFHNCKIEDRKKEEIERGVRMMLKIYKNVFDFDVSKNFQITFQIFGDRKGYIKYRSENSGSSSGVGYYSVGKKEAVIGQYCDRCYCYIKTVYHEASHAILHEHLWHPKWLQEGIAEYFEMMEVYDDKVVIGFSPDRDKACQEWLEEGQLMPVNDLLTLSKSQFNKQNPKMRSLSWSFIYFLMSSKEGQSILKNLIWEMNQAAGAKPSIWNRLRFNLLYDNQEIIERAIPQGIEALDQKWRAWIPQQREKQEFLF
ncbi:MAG: DUF1570 domain-containing protein [Gemmatimonadota bacterium]|nr:DUF1570 domain-containing protein [Gemmatimonadota bacterium]